jgi:hypothetical protein
MLDRTAEGGCPYMIRSQKSRDQRMVPASDWLVARIKTSFKSGKVSMLQSETYPLFERSLKL